MIKLNFSSNEVHIALCREASTSSMAIGIGLTHIRKYHYGQTGFFYSGMISFATGIERLLKLILIYDHRLKNNDAFPTNQQLKGFGHKLVDLVKKSDSIARDQFGWSKSKLIAEDLFLLKIVDFLNDFALQARYYNLDYLSGRIHSQAEPLARWDAEICPTLIARHYTPNDRKNRAFQEIAKKIESISLVSHTAEQGQQINSMSEMFQQNETAPTKQKYSMYYLYQIAYKLSELLRELEYKGRFFPFLREFFTIFGMEDRQHVLRKKTWNPMPPYRF